VAAEDALRIRAVHSDLDLSGRETWPRDALGAPGGWRTAIEIEQLLEVGLAEQVGTDVIVPYTNFQEIDDQMPVALTQAWSKPSPFLLKIDRRSDIGWPDFLYQYQFLLGGRPAYARPFAGSAASGSTGPTGRKWAVVSSGRRSRTISGSGASDKRKRGLFLEADGCRARALTSCFRPPVASRYGPPTV